MDRMPSNAYPHPMTNLAFQAQPVLPHRPEAAAERKSRIARESTIIARAEADIASGLGVDDDDLETWLDALDQDENAPLPAPRSGATSP